MRPRLIAAAVAVPVAAVVAAQLVLPGIAEQRLRDDLSPSGEVRSVDISAFPAVKLLFGRADRVDVKMGDARAGSGRIAELVARTSRTGELRASADSVAIGPLLVRDVRLVKEAGRLSSEASITNADLTAALPAVGLRPVSAGGGELVLEATAPLFGQTIAVRMRLSARDGALVIAPDGLLASIGSLTVFRDPRVQVTSVGARERADGFTVTAEGRLPS